MAESKLRELSMEFSVDIINLVKYLKSNHESPLLQIKSVEAALPSVQIFVKLNMHTAQLILFLKCRSPSKKRTKRVIG